MLVEEVEHGRLHVEGVVVEVDSARGTRAE
jgi:hypothetical protein